MQIYQTILMDHYRHPRNRGSIENPDFSSGSFNPSCGDSITFEGMIIDGTIDRIAFDGFGCVISQATASLLSEAVAGKSLDFIHGLDAAYIKQLIGIDLGPVRLKCALLPLEALQEGMKTYQGAQASTMRAHE